MKKNAAAVPRQAAAADAVVPEGPEALAVREVLVAPTAALARRRANSQTMLV